MMINSVHGQSALAELDDRPTGTRVQITHHLAAPLAFRYAMGDGQVRTMVWP